MALFDAGETVLFDDERGRVTYAPRFVAPAQADAWLAELRGAVDWPSTWTSRRAASCS